MMDGGMMDGMGGMMLGMGLGWLLLLAVLVVAAAALVKYLFFSGRK
jgi:TRAP-type mannitol/chloroaromatic compound transport system permease small subunit